jgi:hypothetical protein
MDIDPADFKDPAAANIVLTQKGVWVRGITAIQRIEGLEGTHNPSVTGFLVGLDGQDETITKYVYTIESYGLKHTLAKNGDKFNNVIFVDFLAGHIALRWPC